MQRLRKPKASKYPAPLPGAGYVTYRRVSTPRQVREGFSLEGQLRQTRAMAKKLFPGVEPLAELSDEGRSGGDPTRAGWVRLLELTRAGRVHTIIISRQDRMSRELADTVGAQFTEWEMQGVLVKWADGTPYEFGWAGQNQRELVAAKNSTDKRELVAKMVDGKLTKANLGAVPQASAPYGLRYVKRWRVPADHPLRDEWADEIVSTWLPDDEHPERGQHVVRLFVDFDASGGTLSLHGLAARLNAAGVPTLLGGRWQHSTIRTMLGNTAYAGTVWWNRYNKINDDYRPVRDTAEWVSIRLPVALIEPALFERVQTFLKRRADHRAAGRKPKQPRPLAGLLRCPNGHRMGAENRSDSRAPIYRCSSQKRCGGFWQVSAELIETSVITAVKDHITHPDRLLRGMASGEAPLRAKLDAERAVVAAELADVEAQLDRLADHLAKGTMAAERIATKSRALEAQRSGLVKQRRQNAEALGALGQDHGARELAEAVRPALDKAAGPVLAGILNRTVREVTVYAGGVAHVRLRRNPGDEAPAPPDGRKLGSGRGRKLDAQTTPSVQFPPEAFQRLSPPAPDSLTLVVPFGPGRSRPTPRPAP
jgi:hypothetical protein